MKKIVIFLSFVLILLTLGGCGKKGFDATLATFFDAIEDENTDKYYSVFVDEYLSDYLINSGGDKVKNEGDVFSLMEALVKQENDDCRERVGKNPKFEYEIVRVRNFHPDDVAFLGKYLSDNYGYDASAVNNVAVLYVDYRLTGEDESEKIYSEEFVTVNVSGKWYLSQIFPSLDSLKDAIEEGALGK